MPRAYPDHIKPSRDTLASFLATKAGLDEPGRASDVADHLMQAFDIDWPEEA